MNPTKRLKGFCSQCGGSIEFRADLIGTTTACPRCGKQTELMLAAPPEQPGVPRKVVVWTLAAVVILVAGLVASMVALKRFEKLSDRVQTRAATRRAAEAATAASGLEASGIALEKGSGSNEVNVVAIVANTSGRPRSQVSAEFEVLDAGGKSIAVARVFRPKLEAGAKWEIKVAVEGAGGAASAKLGAVRAEQ